MMRPVSLKSIPEVLTVPPRFKITKKQQTVFLVSLLDLNMAITLNTARTWYRIVQEILTMQLKMRSHPSVWMK